MSRELVTANDLADVLRKILESNSVDVLGTRALLARYDAQQNAKAQECTGVAAVWCPRCGDCTCSDSVEFASTPNDACPLHGLTSTHADAQHSEPSKPERDESRDVCVYDNGETLGCVYWEDYANNTSFWSVEVERYVPLEQLKAKPEGIQ